MVSLKELLRRTSRELSAAADSPEFEAGVIFEEVFGRDFRLKLLAEDAACPEDCEKLVGSAVKRRLSGEPLQYIIGKWEFYGEELKVGSGALIPRQDTETVVEAALKFLSGRTSPKAADLCSGTGCIALAIKSNRPDTDMTAVELYPEAFEILAENVSGKGINAVRADVLDPKTAESFSELDLITVNPPYLDIGDMENLQREVAFEPRTALYGGRDGLDFYRAIPKIWRNSLKDGGAVISEFGLNQENAVKKLFEEAGFRDITLIDDLTGRKRAISALK